MSQAFRPKILPHRPARVDLWVARATSRKVLTSHPAVATCRTISFFCRGNGWKHFSSLASAHMKHAAYSTQPVKKARRQKRPCFSGPWHNLCEMCPCQDGLRIDWSWLNQRYQSLICHQRLRGTKRRKQPKHLRGSSSWWSGKPHRGSLAELLCKKVDCKCSAQGTMMSTLPHYPTTACCVMERHHVRVDDIRWEALWEVLPHVPHVR